MYSVRLSRERKFALIIGLLIALLILLSRPKAPAAPRAERPNKIFSVQEFLVTNTGLPNIPDAVSLANIRRLIRDFFQPLQRRIGRELVINSGFRSKPVNKAVGGVATSKHLEALATDFKVVGKSGNWLYNKVKEYGFDKMLEYYVIHNSYLHVEFK